MDPGLFKALFLIVAVIGSIVWNAYQKRRQEEEEARPWLPPQPKGDPLSSRPPPPRAAPRPVPAEKPNWEEQLRRLLEGESPVAPPPPVVIIREATPAPPPLPRAIPAPRPPVAEEVDPMDIGLPVNFPSLTQSAAAHHRATHLDESVAERFRKAGEQVTLHSMVAPPPKSGAELRRARSFLHDRQSQRAAIVASVVLGPPKALEN